MRQLVLGCSALLALALIVIVFSTGPYPDVLFELPSQLRPQHIAWIFIAIVAVVALAAAIWSHEKLEQQRRASELLDSRLRLEEAQRDVDRATNQLGRTIPDSAMRELQERLSRAEKELAAQQRRGDAAEFQARVEEIRERQQGLKEKLGDVIATRTSIERLFVEYESTQADIERTISGIEVDQKGDALDARIGNLTQFTKITGSRLQELAQSRQVLLDLKDEFDALHGRLAPLKDERGGIKGLIHQLNDMNAQLLANIEALERDGDVSLAERIKRITETRRELSQRVLNLADELSKLDDSHKDFNALFARLSHELNTRVPSGLELGASVVRRTAAE
jgi:chromosome segregation ATPase